MTRRDASTASSIAVAGATTSSVQRYAANAGVAAARQQPAPHIDAAVYAHVRALRALGTTTVNSGEIADALRLARRDVETALRGMSSRGVRLR